MPKITFKCPHCKRKLVATERLTGKHLACPGCSQTVIVPTVNEPPKAEPPKAEPPAPINITTPPPRTHKTTTTTKPNIAQITLGIGLLIIAISPLFNWINLAMGGTLGISGDGKILLIITLAALALYTLQLLKPTWTTPTTATIQAWGILTITWMTTLLWKISTITKDPEMANNPFAQIIVTQISPGTGLYLGIIGGTTTTIATTYLLFKQKTYPTLAISSTLALIIGITFTLYYNTNTLPNNQTAQDTQDTVIPYGQAYTDQDLQLSIAQATIDHPNVHDDIRDTTIQSPEPHLLITLHIKNLSDRKKLTLDTNQFMANYALKDDVDNIVRRINFGIYELQGALDDHDILPGQQANHLLCFETPLPKTQHLTLKIDLQLLNKTGLAQFHIPYNQIK